jgi:hypothetical protein
VNFSEIAPDLQMVYFTGKKCTWEELNVTKELGEGGFATVHLGEMDGAACAVKKLKVFFSTYFRILQLTFEKNNKIFITTIGSTRR